MVLLDFSWKHVNCLRIMIGRESSYSIKISGRKRVILSKSAIGRHFYILYVCVAADLGCLQGLCISVS